MSQDRQQQPVPRTGGDGELCDTAPARPGEAAYPEGPSAAGRHRRTRRLRAGAVALAAVSAVGVSAGVIASASGSEPAGKPGAVTGQHIDPDKANIEGEKVYKNLSRAHTEGPVDYSDGPTPPVGGRHNPTWQNADGDVYTEPLKNEHAVHTLEHGAVWATYSDDASAEDVKALRTKVEGVPYRFMSPVPEQEGRVELTAWGHQLSLSSARDPRADEFFDAYVQGPQTPEEGAPVTGGRSKP